MNLTIHSTATMVTEDPTVDDLWKKDVAGGFPTIGCHYVITKDGTLHSCRSLDKPSMYDERPGCISVLVVGGGETWKNFTPEQVDALKRVAQLHPSHQPKPIGRSTGVFFGLDSP